jgi:hypothetical protein
MQLFVLKLLRHDINTWIPDFWDGTELNPFLDYLLVVLAINRRVNRHQQDCMRPRPESNEQQRTSYSFAKWLWIYSITTSQEHFLKLFNFFTVVSVVQTTTKLYCSCTYLQILVFAAVVVGLLKNRCTCIFIFCSVDAVASVDCKHLTVYLARATKALPWLTSFIPTTFVQQSMVSASGTNITSYLPCIFRYLLHWYLAKMYTHDACSKHSRSHIIPVCLLIISIYPRHKRHPENLANRMRLYTIAQSYNIPHT